MEIEWEDEKEMDAKTIADFVRTITRETGELTRKEICQSCTVYVWETDFGDFKFSYDHGYGSSFDVSYKGEHVLGLRHYAFDSKNVRLYGKKSGEWENKLEDLIKNKDEVISDYKAKNSSLLATKKERQRKVEIDAYERATKKYGPDSIRQLYEHELQKGLVSPLFGEDSNFTEWITKE